MVFVFLTPSRKNVSEVYCAWIIIVELAWKFQFEILNVTSGVCIKQ